MKDSSMRELQNDLNGSITPTLELRNGTFIVGVRDKLYYITFKDEIVTYEEIKPEYRF